MGIIVASVGTAMPDSGAANMVLIVFAASWGPVAWVVTSEIYPLKVRAKSMSISTASNWLLNFSLGYGTPYLVNPGQGYANLQSKVFFIWGTFCALAVVFVWAM